MSPESVSKLWRYGAGQLLLGSLALELALVAYQVFLGSGNGLQAGKLFFWTGIDVFLLWRIWRGGKASWTVKVALDSLIIVLLVTGQTWPWGWYGTGLLAMVSVQLLLLLSPAIRHHRPKLASG